MESIESSSSSLCLAVDIGGTKLAVGVVDGSGRLVQRLMSPTPVTASGDELFAAVAALVNRFGPFDRFIGCGVGCGGPMSAGGDLVSPLNIPAWRQFPLRHRLHRLTGLATFVDNDAKALALGEGWVGAAVGERNYIAMVVSTTALAAHSGRPAAEATTAEIHEAGTLVGRAAGSAANLLDLKLIVVAGSVALGFGEPFFAAAQAEVDRICQLDYSRGTRIRPAGCGDEGPLIGAAAVGRRGLGLPVGLVR